MKFLFANSWWLALIPALAVGGYFLWRFILQQVARRVSLFVSARLASEAIPASLQSGKRLRFILRACALGVLVLALARPMTDPTNTNAERKGVDFVLLLDVSKSMLCADVDPSRLDAVKKELAEWFQTLSGDRVGLVVFAGDAFVQAPLTVDYGALTGVLEEAGPQSVSLGGSNIAQGIETAAQMLANNDIDPRVIILISDGGSQEGDPIAAARKAKETDKTTILTVGVGTATGARVPDVGAGTWKARQAKKAAGETLPPRGRPVFVRDEYGIEVTSRLDERTLSQIATASGGRYYHFVPGGHTFDTLRQQSLINLKQSSKKVNLSELTDWFQVPLFIAIMLLVAESLVPALKKRPAQKKAGVAVIQPTNLSDLETTQQSMDTLTTAPSHVKPTGKKPKVRVPMSLIAGGLLIAAAMHAGAATDSGLQDIEQLLKEGKKDVAVEQMRKRTQANMEDQELFYNLGMTLYRAGQYQEAIEVFQALQRSTNDAAMVSRAELQIGNANYHLATLVKKTGPIAGAALAMERAYDSYDSLNRSAGTREAEHNVKIAATELEQLLMQVGDDRMAAATKTSDKTAPQEKNLRDALQAYERINELNPKNEEAKKKAAEVRAKLAENLVKQAQELAVQADAEDAKPKGDKDRKDAALKGVETRKAAVAKLDDAQTNAPEDKKIEALKQEQLKKISDKLTAEAEQDMAAPMQKDSLTMKEQNDLESARTKLDGALAANPDNKKAADLRKAAGEKLDKSYTEDGQKQMAAADKQPDAQRKFDQTNQAAQNFQKALAINPENKPAQDGLKQANDKLPDLQAAAGKQGLDAAKAALGKNGAPPPPPAGGAAGQPPPPAGGKGGAPPPPGKGGAPTPAQLADAINTLEKSAQNFDSALAMRPDNNDYKAGLAEARNLLETSRGELEATKNAQAANGQEGQPAPGQDGQDSAQAGAQDGGPTMKTMTALRGGRVKPKTTDNFWNKKVRDW